MILSRKPTTPEIVPCSCGCGQDLALPREVWHVLKVAAGRSAWHYRAHYVQIGDDWGLVRFTATHHFQPAHRRALTAWYRPASRRPRRALTFGHQPRSIARRSA